MGQTYVTISEDPQIAPPPPNTSSTIFAANICTRRMDAFLLLSYMIFVQ